MDTLKYVNPSLLKNKINNMNTHLIQIRFDTKKKFLKLDYIGNPNYCDISTRCFNIYFSNESAFLSNLIAQNMQVHSFFFHKVFKLLVIKLYISYDNYHDNHSLLQ